MLESLAKDPGLVRGFLSSHIILIDINYYLIIVIRLVSNQNSTVNFHNARILRVRVK